MSSRAELFSSLGSVCESPGPASPWLAAALGLPGSAEEHDFTDVFVFQLYPYSSVYVGAEGMLGGEARDRAAGFWRALGLAPPAEPDHLAALLGLYASLIDAELSEPDDVRRALRRESRKALLWEHLLSWLLPYADKVREIGAPFYVGWAELLLDAIIDEARTLGSQDTLPLHLREAPSMSSPVDDPASFLCNLLAPVRSGMILTRSHLARAARDLNLGLRVGERRFVLESLLAQDPDATLAWLIEEALRSAARHERHAGELEDISLFWRRRAETAAALLSKGLTSGGEEVVDAARRAG